MSLVLTGIANRKVTHYLVTIKHRDANLDTVANQLLLDARQWHNKYGCRTLSKSYSKYMHVLRNLYFTRWKEAGSDEHGQGFSHTSGQAAQDMLVVLRVYCRTSNVGLHLLCQ